MVCLELALFFAGDLEAVTCVKVAAGHSAFFEVALLASIGRLHATAVFHALYLVTDATEELGSAGVLDAFVVDGDGIELVWAI